MSHGPTVPRGPTASTGLGGVPGCPGVPGSHGGWEGLRGSQSGQGCPGSPVSSGGGGAGVPEGPPVPWHALSWGHPGLSGSPMVPGGGGGGARGAEAPGVPRVRRCGGLRVSMGSNASRVRSGPVGGSGCLGAPCHRGGTGGGTGQGAPGTRCTQGHGGPTVAAGPRVPNVPTGGHAMPEAPRGGRGSGEGAREHRGCVPPSAGRGMSREWAISARPRPCAWGRGFREEGGVVTPVGVANEGAGRGRLRGVPRGGEGRCRRGGA